jgi:hypothetical protein
MSEESWPQVRTHPAMPPGVMMIGPPEVVDAVMAELDAQGDDLEWPDFRPDEVLFLRVAPPADGSPM